MKYLTVSSVVSAYNTNKECTKSKFWGLLAILSSIDYIVKPGFNYDFDTSKVSNFLEELFCLESDVKHYQNSSLWNVMFSKIWAEKASELMLSATPNIYDVAVWYYRRSRFQDDISASGLIKMFLESTHISETDAKKLFSFSVKDIEFSEIPYTEIDLRKALGISSSNINAEGSSIVAHPGELSRAPFIQTLYAGQSQMECLIITQFKFSELYVGIPESKDYIPLKGTAQIIYYGCPGTGKSRTVKEKTEGLDDEMIISYDDPELPTNVYRTTFHPDYDYATFVGCYKPVKDDSGLDYRFIPQVFTKAYATACLHPEDPVYLIIEEINRGNCAQIFGDLFQLLDRKEGKSEYPIVPDSELSKYLKTKGVVEYTKLCLPANLHIYATMNTSDQSLFPMDSAFKRRWAMEYVPIDYEKKKAKEFTITLKNDKVYKWVDFLKAVNEKISFATDSEDKQMGEFFIKSSVKSDEFKNKVMFYLWSEICKDLYSTKGSGQKYFMRIEEQKPDPLTGITPLDQFTFSDLFSDRNRNDELLESFFIRLGLYEDGKPESNSVAEQQDTEPVTNE